MWRFQHLAGSRYLHCVNVGCIIDEPRAFQLCPNRSQEEGLIQSSGAKDHSFLVQMTRIKITKDTTDMFSIRVKWRTSLAIPSISKKRRNKKKKRVNEGILFVEEYPAEGEEWKETAIRLV